MKRPTASPSAHRRRTLLAVLLSTAAGLAQQNPPPAAPTPALLDVSVHDALARARRVLWVGAHPDDENVAGGLIARARDRTGPSGRLFLYSMTAGHNSPVVWGGLKRGTQIGNARRVLFARAARLFGADAARVGPFGNGPRPVSVLDRLPPNAPFVGWGPRSTSSDVIRKWNREGNPVRELVQVLRAWKPDVVVLMDHHCGVSGNVEHMATARLTVEAVAKAADARWFPGVGAPWRVGYLVFSARVIPAIGRERHPKCEGNPRPEPIEAVSAMEASTRNGWTYFRIAGRVKLEYRNTMEQKGWTPAQMDRMSADAEKAALAAWRKGVRSFPLTEPYRVRTVR